MYYDIHMYTIYIIINLKISYIYTSVYIILRIITNGQQEVHTFFSHETKIRLA